MWERVHLENACVQLGLEGKKGRECRALRSQVSQLMSRQSSDARADAPSLALDNGFHSYSQALCRFRLEKRGSQAPETLVSIWLANQSRKPQHLTRS